MKVTVAFPPQEAASGFRMVQTGYRAEIYPGRTSLKEVNTTHPGAQDAIVLVHGLWMTPCRSEWRVERHEGIIVGTECPLPSQTTPSVGHSQ